MSNPVTTIGPAVDPVTVPAVGEDPWVADLADPDSHPYCQSTVVATDYRCEHIPKYYAQIEVWSYPVANPRWEGKLCNNCLTGWLEWAAFHPEGIKVVSVNPIVTGD